jgi:hypothetical protein
MTDLIKFLGKLILPFIISYIFLSVIQGFQFNVMSWSILMQRVFTSVSYPPLKGHGLLKRSS